MSGFPQSLGFSGVSSISSTGTVRSSSSSQAGVAALAEDKDRLALYARAAVWVAV
jgi:hypothetical protein